jgi:hypothetical protein
MNNLITILLIFLVVKTFAQVPNNRNDQLTREEFIELIKYKDLFVPTDLKNDTVIIVQYSPASLPSMILAARKLSFSENGTDTTGVTNGSAEVDIKWLQKLASRTPERLRKHFKKKGIQCIIVEEKDLLNQERFTQKYWVKSTFISDQTSLEDRGWVLSYLQFFHDPRNNKNYETLLVANHELLELVE